MPTFIEQSTGIVAYDQKSPGPGWEEIPRGGTAFRTRLDNGQWIAQRVDHMRCPHAHKDGWEQVLTTRRSPRPKEWHQGGRSSIRFGFARLDSREKADGADNVAVVLPDEPGMYTSANCPGSRYVFPPGMLVGGLPEDYLTEKLLTFRLRKIGIHPGVLKPVPSSSWQKQAFEKLHCLAWELSEDIRQVAIGRYGQQHTCAGWTRDKQTAAFRRGSK